MDISLRTSYHAPLPDVLTLLLSEELAHARAQALHVANFSFTQEQPEPAVIQSVMRARVPASELPANVRGFLRGGLGAVVTSSYHRERTPAVIEYTIRIDGAPVNGALTLTLTPADELSTASAAGTSIAATDGQIAGSFSVNVPFIGGKIERTAAAHANTVLTADTALVNSLLAKH